ncbi:MAG: DegT/DnrJ/EryC1/StrS family aminotransferase [Roseburia sp.]|nr:DegT/DnrJ/EryC1/StrS family aminotransferase [Roseburia sp.]MCM1237563.1 DegT/DnrJ/EryC1/StrS family aminotransferase [Ruminococcus flavefaciens]
MSKIFVTRSSMPPLEEYVSEISDIWSSHWLTNMGKKHKELQEKLSDYLQVENVDLLVNGHMALELTMQAMGLQGEVITTPYTFASTTHAIVRNGLEPVFCDINSRNYTIDTEKIERLITDNTCAIVPVHVYGNVCNIEEIDRIARKYGLKVIYDAAHAFGVTYKDKGIGTFGDASCFSFHATKLFHTIEGGAVCFKDREFGTELYRLKNFGIKNEEVVDGVGANAKMNEFCAAMGLCNLKHMDRELDRRKVLVEKYRNRLSDVKGIILNSEQKGVKPNHAYFPIIIEEKDFGSGRNEVYDKLLENDICARKYFYPLTNSFKCFYGKYDVNETPIALHISKRVLTLPLYADLDVECVDKICDIILTCKKSNVWRNAE